MQRLAPLCFALVLACGSSAKHLDPPSAGSGGSDGGEVAPRTPTVIANPGEQMIYRISLHGIDVAEFTVTIGAATTLGGKPVIPVQTCPRNPSSKSAI